jgi:S1-C subfamily serine protease
MNPSLPGKLANSPDNQELSLHNVRFPNSQVARLSSTVGRIATESGNFQKFGSCVVIDDDGTALTALHVLTVDYSRNWTRLHASIDKSPRSEIHGPIDILATDRDLDLAVVKLPSGPQYRAATIAADSPAHNERVVTIGYPNNTKQLNAGLSVRLEKLENAPRTIIEHSVVQDTFGLNGTWPNLVTTAYTSNGGSGGGVFDMKGQLVGIVTAYRRWCDIHNDTLSRLSGAPSVLKSTRVSIARSIEQIRAAFPSLFGQKRL